MFSGVILLCFSLSDSISSRYFHWFHLPSRATIFASCQLILFVQVVECFASPPSFVFILVVANSVFPNSLSSVVNRTLLRCSLCIVSHFLCVAPVYKYSLQPHGILYTTFEFLLPSSVVLAFVVSSFTRVPLWFATLNLSSLLVAGNIRTLVKHTESGKRDRKNVATRYDCNGKDEHKWPRACETLYDLNKRSQLGGSKNRDSRRKMESTKISGGNWIT